VLKGKRDVKGYYYYLFFYLYLCVDTIFIESTTGEINKVSDILKYILREKEKDRQKEKQAEDEVIF
jgi:hypothetical protein